MQRNITITHTASGNWYGPKKFELRTIELVYTTQYDEPSEPIQRFDVVHHRVLHGKRTTSSRRFVSESERAGWVETELGSLEFQELPEPMNVVKQSRLAPLAGLVLRSVMYDETGTNLSFGAPDERDHSHELFVTGEIAVWEGIETARPIHSIDANAVVGLVGSILARVDEYTDTGLWLTCQDGRAFSISPGLRTKDEEVAVLSWSEKSATWAADDPLFSSNAPA